MTNKKDYDNISHDLEKEKSELSNPKIKVFWHNLFDEIIKERQNLYVLVPPNLTRRVVTEHFRSVFKQISNTYGLEYSSFGKSAKTELRIKIYPTETKKNEFYSFSIVVTSKAIYIHILSSAFPILLEIFTSDSFYLEEFYLVDYIVKKVFEELFEKGKINLLREIYVQIEKSFENLTPKTIEIAQNTIKTLYEAKKKSNQSLLQKNLYSSLLIDGKQVVINHSDFLKNPAVLTDLLK